MHYGIPAADPVLPADQTLTTLRDGEMLVGAVSVLRVQKRLDVLLRAIPVVWDVHPSARFVVVGNGPLQATLTQQAAELGLLDDPRFAFLPFSRPSLRYLRALDLFVLPSAWEAMPIAVLEALAAGTPQVVTDVNGTSEATTPETGWLFRRRTSRHSPKRSSTL